MRAIFRAAVVSVVPLLSSLTLTSAARAQSSGWTGPGCGDTASTHVRFDMPIRLTPRPLPGYPAWSAPHVSHSAVVDLDGDAWPEIVSAQFQEGGYTLHEDVLKEEPDRATSVALPDLPRDVKGGDVNGDGHVDIAFTLYAGRELGVFLGRGDGTFEPCTNWPVGDADLSGPIPLALADLDSDGATDAVMGCIDDSIRVLFGNGDGTFGGPMEFATNGTFSDPDWGWARYELAEILAVDVTGDGRPDLVANDPESKSMRCLVNLGGRTFSAPHVTVVPNGTGGFAAGDLDGDGATDLVVASVPGPSLLFGDGTGAFVVRDVGSSVGSLGGVTLADLDEDGLLDVVAAEALPTMFFSPLRVYHNLGGRRFERAAAYQAVSGVSQIESADVNHDGHPDIVATAEGTWGAYCAGATGSVDILLGRGDLRLGSASVVEAPPTDGVLPPYVEADSPLLMTLRLDGPLDDMVLQSSRGIRVVRSLGRMGMQVSDSLGHGYLLAVRDLDRDGYQDVIAGYGDTVAASRGLPGHTLAAQQVVGTGWNFLALGRFDTDDSPDLLVHDALGNVLLARGSGDATFQPAQPTGYALPAVESVEPRKARAHASTGVDLDLDGIDELAVLIASGQGPSYARADDILERADDTLEVVRIHPDGSAAAPVQTAIPWAGFGEYSYDFPHQLHPADFDADGRPDLLALRGGWNGVLSFIVNRGAGGFEIVRTTWAGSEYVETAITDLNGDLRSDVLITSSLLNDAPALAWEVSQGGDSFLRGYRSDLSYGPLGVTTGAFDDDPRPDVAVLAPWQNLSVLFNRTAYIDAPTPVLASLVDASVVDGIAHLVWSTDASPATEAVLTRKVGDGAWTELARVHPDGDGRVRFTDAALTPGQRHGYRLAFAERGALVLVSETWLEVPARAGLWLAGARPNPASDGLTVAFSLESRGPGTLAVFDIAGRKVATRDLSALAPGEHLVRVAERGSLRSGLYLVRLTTPERTLTCRAAVVR